MVDLARNDLVTVGASSTSISSEKVNSRSSLYIRNSSGAGQTITVSFGVPAVANTGYILAVGDFILIEDTVRTPCYQGQVNAIASAAGGQVSVVER